MIRNSNCLLRTLCRVVVVALLFSQAAFATQPCVTPGMTAASMMSSHMDDDCDMQAAGSSNLCVMKCVDSDKLSAHTPLVVPPPPTTAIAVLTPLPDDGRAVVAMRSLIAPLRGPPKSILYCSFLI